jgi:hypothetical protein
MKEVIYMEGILIAVNGTLMRDLELNKNLTSIGATFIRVDKTDSYYRLWSINDVHPAMIRTTEKNSSVDLEIWEVPAEEIATLLLNEPAGLSIGKVILEDKSICLGVLGESFLCEDQLEITEYGGWRSYIEQRSK